MSKKPTLIEPIDTSFDNLTKISVMKKEKNIAGGDPMKIKDLELKMSKNIAGVQSEFIFDVEVEKEINGIQMGVLKGGTPYLTQTGLAKLCGVARKMIYNIDQELNAVIFSNVFDRLIKEHTS